MVSTSGFQRRTKLTTVRTPASLTALAISFKEAASVATGFSIRRCLPALAPATVSALCSSGGVQMERASTRGSARRSP